MPNEPTPSTAPDPGYPRRNGPPGMPPRQRPPPRRATVARIETLSPRMRRIVFGGEALAGFGPARPGAHIKLIFGEPPAGGLGPGKPRPPMRTYTPRHFDPARCELAVDFYLHGGGLAGAWAAEARVGERIHIGGPGGGTDIDPALRAAVLLVDETAMPAAGMILDALPAHCHATVVCEVEDAAEERALTDRPVDTMLWLHRAPTGAAPGASLLDAAARLPLPEGAQWWVACESGAMRAIKALLTGTRGVDRTRIVSRGYWQQGAADHPDHDHGE